MKKRKRTLKFEALEAMPIEWVWDLHARNIFVTDELIKEKVRRILDLLNTKLDDN